MRLVWQRVAALWRAEIWLLASVLVIAALLLGFGWLAGEVMEGETASFDRQVFLLFRNSANPADPLGPPWVAEMARDITALGSFSVLALLLGAVVGYLFLAQQGHTAWLVLVSVLGGLVISHLLKYGFDRARPDLVPHAARVFTASFPSGHATLSAVTYLTLGALLTRTQQSWRIRIFFMVVAVVLTLLVGLSRIYLGVHYPTDVLAGWCIGAAWALASWTLMARLQIEGQVEPPKPS